VHVMVLCRLGEATRTTVRRISRVRSCAGWLIPRGCARGMHGSRLAEVIYILMESSRFEKLIAFGGVTGVARGLAIDILQEAATRF